MGGGGGGEGGEETSLPRATGGGEGVCAAREPDSADGERVVCLGAAFPGRTPDHPDADLPLINFRFSLRCRKAKNSLARTGHQRGMGWLQRGGRETEASAPPRSEPKPRPSSAATLSERAAMDSRYRPHTPSTLRTVRSFGAQLGSTLPEERGSSPLFVRASFEVRCETDWGESVAVVGSTAQLGAWRPEAGMRMTTNQRIYPSWRSEPLLLSEVLELEYKFVVIGPDGNAARARLRRRRRPTTTTPHRPPLACLRRAGAVGAAAAQPAARPPVGERGAGRRRLGPAEQHAAAVAGGPALARAAHRQRAGRLVRARADRARAGGRARRRVRQQRAGPPPGSSLPTAFPRPLSSPLCRLRPPASRRAPPAAAAPTRQAPREASGIAPAVDMTVDLPAGRLLVVQQHLPFNVAQAEDGSWGGARGESSAAAGRGHVPDGSSSSRRRVGRVGLARDEHAGRAAHDGILERRGETRTH